jgi:ribosomal protein S18 acetylase RimI-like enzyme
MIGNAVTVRAAEPADRAVFLTMWRDFVALAPGEPGNHSMGELNWERIIDPAHALCCIMAEETAGTPCGFTLFIALPFTWSTGDACYLQDIYVAEENRGKGIARAMIAELRHIGQQAGWFKIFWMTQSDNYAAQRLYDKVAKRMDYLRYDLNVCDP